MLHTNAMLGRSNEYQAECVRRYPDRLLSMAIVDERQIHTDVDSVIASVTTAIRALGCTRSSSAPVGTSSATSRGTEVPTSRSGRPSRRLACPFSSPGHRSRPCQRGHADTDGQRGYLGELRILMRLMDRYPQMLCSITHGFPWRVYLDGERITLPNEIWSRSRTRI